MEGQDDGVDTEECVSAQHFRVPVLEVEGFMWGCGRGVRWKLVIGSVCDGGVDGRFVVRGIRDREVGETSYADGWGMSDGSDGRCRNRNRV